MILSPEEAVMKLAAFCASLFLLGALTGCGDASTDGGGTGGSGNPSSTVCESFCGTLSECGYGLMSGDCLPQCQSRSQEASNISSACREAADAEGRCVGALSCEQLQDWIDEPPNYPCSAEDMAASVACNP